MASFCESWSGLLLAGQVRNLFVFSDLGFGSVFFSSVLIFSRIWIRENTIWTKILSSNFFLMTLKDEISFIKKNIQKDWNFLGFSLYIKTKRLNFSAINCQTCSWIWIDMKFGRFFPLIVVFYKKNWKSKKKCMYNRIIKVNTYVHWWIIVPLK